MGDLRFPLHAAREDDPKTPGDAEQVQKSAHRGSGIRSREAALKAIGKDLAKKVRSIASDDSTD